MEYALAVADLIAALPVIHATGPSFGAITSVVYHAGDVTPGACFVAIPGRKTDGYQFIPDALRAGASVIIGEQAAPPNFPTDRVYLQVADARRAQGSVAAALFGDPSRRMQVIGVTGTDGKTTTANLIDALLSAGNHGVGLISTVDFKIGEQRTPNNSRFTTLEAPEMQRILAEMADAQIERAIVETTSSGLALHRVQGVAYDIAVITNITSEHLEVHGTLEAYWRAKAMLFEAIDPAAPPKPGVQPTPRACVLNADDASYAYLRDFCHAPVLTYGATAPADVFADNVRLEATGTQFRVTLPYGRAFEVRTPLVARYNLSNCLAAIAVGHLCSIPPEVMAQALATFPGVPGRMERIDAGQPFTVVVDYAHTAESLDKVLGVLRPLTTGSLIALFGSAGDRDRVKRPAMGEVAARMSDYAVITDEDPREEDAMSILREIAAGAEAAGAREHERYECIVGRRQGIRAAFERAQAGDTVLLAGKGHEQSIVIGREKLPWDDRREAREALAELGYRAL